MTFKSYSLSRFAQVRTRSGFFNGPTCRCDRVDMDWEAWIAYSTLRAFAVLYHRRAIV